jgi:hypothetical protein
MRDTVVAIVAARRGYEILPELDKARAHILYSSLAWNRLGAVPDFSSGPRNAITMIPGLRYAVGKGNLCC